MQMTSSRDDKQAEGQRDESVPASNTSCPSAQQSSCRTGIV